MQNNTPISRSNRIAKIELSEIIKITEDAAQMKRQGHDVIGLGAGEPDFSTPDHVHVAASKAMDNGDTKYPPTAGTPELKTAICESLIRDSDVEVSQSQVIVCTGAKQVLFNLFMATLNPGDEVIVPAPYWTSYIDMVSISSGIPKVVACGPDVQFKLTPAALEKAIGPRTRWLLLNSPGNPTGAAYTAAEIRALADVLLEHPHVGLISDEIYQHITYDGFTFQSALKIAPELADRMLIVNGVSKAYAMTGWRIGYGIGPSALIKAMVTVQGQSTSGACSIAQAAAVAALSGPQDLLADRRNAFQRRRDIVVAELNKIEGISCLIPDGAFYVFPSCAGLLGRVTPTGDVLHSSVDFCHYLLRAEGVAIVPGRAFGAPEHFRISYAYAEKTLIEACKRIQRACAALK